MSGTGQSRCGASVVRRPGAPDGQYLSVDRTGSREPEGAERHRPSVEQHAQAGGNARVSQVGGDQYIVGRHQYIVVQIAGSADGSRFWEGCPYLGLMPFGAEHAPLFFGRRALLDRLVERLRAQLSAAGPLVVTGPSGAGKSSMLKAGLLPRLGGDALGEGSSRWPRVEMTPTDDPFAELAARLTMLPGLRDSPVSAEALAAGPRHLVAAAQTAIRAATAGSRNHDQSPRLLLVVDQAEDLFILEPAACAAFLTMLSEAAAPVLVVLSVRGDFLDRLLDQLPGQAGRGMGDVFRVDRMTEAELRQAIEGPAARTGLALDDDLTGTVIRELRGAAGTPTFDVGVLPLLSQAMLMTWKTYRERGSGGGEQVMTASDFHDAGGLGGAVEASAEEVYDSLSAEGRAAAEAVLTRLCVVQADGRPARRRATRQDLAAATGLDLPAVDAVLHQFAARRLVVLDGDSAEISHDALLRAWSRLQSWLEADIADRVLMTAWREDADAWDSNGRDPSYLYRGTQLADIERAAARWGDDPERYARPVEVQAAFLAAGRLAAAGSARRRRLVVTGAAAAMVVVLAVTATAIHFFQASAERRAHALSLDLAAESLAISAENPVTARRLAAAAWKADETAEAKRSMTWLLGQQHHGGMLVGHTEAVTALAFSPDGSRLASGGDDDTVRLWDTATRTALGAPATGHGANINAVAFSPDGSQVASAGDDDNARLWTADGTPAGAPIPLPIDDVGIDGPVQADLAQRARDSTEVAFAADGRLLTFSDNDLRAWDVRSAQAKGTAAPAEGFAVVTMHGHRLAVTEPARGDGTMRLFDTTTGRASGARVPVYSSGARPVFSANGTRVANVAEDGYVRVWDARSGEVLATLPTQDVGASVLALSPDGRHLATSDRSGNAVSLWDVTGEPVLRRLTGHTGAVTALAFHPDGTRLATAGNDTTIRLWNVASAGPAGTALTARVPGLRQLVFGPGPDRIATVDAKNRVRVWDRATGRPVRSPLDSIEGAELAVLSPDGTRLALSRSRNFFEAWDVSAGTRIGGAKANDMRRIGILQFSPDGRWLAMGPPNAQAGPPEREKSAELWIWDMTGSELMARPLTGDNHIAKVLFSPDGRWIAVSSGFTVRMWDVASRKPTGVEMSGHNHGLTHMAFSADSTRFATSSLVNNAVAWLWDPRTGERLRELPGHEDLVWRIAFDAGGRSLATAGSDETVRLWHPADGSPAGVLAGHPGPVAELAYAAGPELLAVASGNTLSLWDLARAALVESPVAVHASAVEELVVSPDGRTIATGGADGSVALWDLSYLDDPHRALCATAGPPSGDDLEPYPGGPELSRICD